MRRAIPLFLILLLPLAYSQAYLVRNLGPQITWSDGEYIINAGDRINVILREENTAVDLNRIEVAVHVTAKWHDIKRKYCDELGTISPENTTTFFEREVTLKPEVKITPCTYDPKEGKWKKGIYLVFYAEWRKDIFNAYKRRVGRINLPSDADVRYGALLRGQDNREGISYCAAIDRAGYVTESDEIEIRVDGRTLSSLMAYGTYTLKTVEMGARMLGNTRYYAVPFAERLTPESVTWQFGELRVTAPYLTSEGWCTHAQTIIEYDCAAEGGTCKLEDATIPIDDSNKDIVEWCRANGTYSVGTYRFTMGIVRSSNVCSNSSGCIGISLHAEDSFSIRGKKTLAQIVTDNPDIAIKYKDYISDSATCSATTTAVSGGYLCVSEDGRFALISEKRYTVESMPQCPFLQFAAECSNIELNIVKHACKPDMRDALVEKLAEECGRKIEVHCDSPTVEDCIYYLPLIQDPDWNSVMDKCIEYDQFREYLVEYLRTHGDDKLSAVIAHLIQEYNEIFTLKIVRDENGFLIIVDDTNVGRTDAGEVNTDQGTVEYNSDGIFITDGNTTAEYTGDYMEIRNGKITIKGKTLDISPNTARERVEQEAGAKAEKIFLKAGDDGPEYEVKLDNGRIVRVNSEGETKQETRKSGGTNWGIIFVSAAIITGVGLFAASKKGYI